MDADSLKAERKNNAGTIAGLRNRIALSQEEIDLLTARNVAIDALLAPKPAESAETPAPAPVEPHQP